jgi:hypothetical protein
MRASSNSCALARFPPWLAMAESSIAPEVINEQKIKCDELKAPHLQRDGKGLKFKNAWSPSFHRLKAGRI